MEGLSITGSQPPIVGGPRPSRLSDEYAIIRSTNVPVGEPAGALADALSASGRKPVVKHAPVNVAGKDEKNDQQNREAVQNPNSDRPSVPEQ